VLLAVLLAGESSCAMLASARSLVLATGQGQFYQTATETMKF